MWRTLVVTFLTLTLLLAPGRAEAAFTFDDVDYWVGSGSNQAALVFDWNDGIEPQSLAWGYRWDGTATGQDMLFDVLEDDDGLYAKVKLWSSPSGYTLMGIGYDLDGDGFSLTDGATFTDGIFEGELGLAEDATSEDPDDHYKEGWYTGYWSYWLSDDDPYGTGAWELSGVGMSARTLTDGDWDGWSFDQDLSSFFNPSPDDFPSEPVVGESGVVPEPSSFAIVVGLGVSFGGGAWLRRRRTEHSQRQSPRFKSGAS